ncbi:filamentous hemagglutinin N-terminal domain-containing protein [Caballeronia sp. GAFFF1]|uniref:two-partner secretion domain-containing protein n=1 Tax=Caballeronia sp. GAFFF1 TaxID=2921779 RepID=UPI0020283B7C|nr:filamentous hemagglutinin N-terminal domain-containing protein [Caballeronia sp. GAFFF1]
MSDITSFRTRRHRRAWERAIRRLAKRAARHAGIELTPVALLPLLALVVAPGALALPAGGQVVNGNVSINTPAPKTMSINQGSQKGIVNWNSFSIGAGEAVNISQPSAQAVLLNRVVGSQASTIAGQINANGQVFLVNPAGVLFARGASVNVGSLVASTLGISDADFLAGKYHFMSAAPNAGGRVVNQGAITAGERGTVALLGAQVDNSGTVSAKLGTVAMGAGSDITLDFAGDGLTMIKVDGAAAQALASNSGALAADGGQVLMSVQTADALAGTVLNQTGTVRAQSVVERNGRIVLDGGAAGVTSVTGNVDVTGGAGLAGGQADVTGYHIAMNDGARIDASGATGGGRVRVGGGAAGRETDIHNADAVWMGPAAQARADALVNGDGGHVVIYGANAAHVHGTLTAKGGKNSGNGGLIETSARFLDVAGANIDASALHGVGGTWVLDPFNVTITNSTSVDSVGGPNFVASTDNSVISAGTINDRLNAGTSVLVDTGTGGTQDGDISLQGQISKTGGAATTLTLQAARSIVADRTLDGGGAAAIVASQLTGAPASPLSVVLIANTAGHTDGTAEIRLRGSTGNAPMPFFTNGGDVRIGAPANGVAPRVVIDSVNMDTRTRTGAAGTVPTFDASAPSGAITINGHGPVDVIGGVAGLGFGVNIENGSVLQTTTGAISITGDGVTGGVRIGGGGGVGASSVSSTSGGITLNGTSSGGTGLGIAGATISTTAGALSLTGDGGQGGVAAVGASLSTASGNMSLSGTSSGGVGLSLSTSALRSDSGSLALTGEGGGGGVSLDFGSITAGTGNISVDGTARAPGSGSRADGVAITATPFTTAGGITIRGQAALNGVQGGGVTIAAAGEGTVTLTAGLPGIRVYGSGNGYEGVLTTSIASDTGRRVSFVASDEAGSGPIEILGVTNGAPVTASGSDTGFHSGLKLGNASLDGSNLTLAGSIAGGGTVEQPGLQITDSTVTASPGSTLTLRASNTSANTSSIALDAGSTSLDTRSALNASGGALVLAPGIVTPGTSFTVAADDPAPISIGVTGATGPGFVLDSTFGQRFTSSIDTVYIGSETHAGPITLGPMTCLAAPCAGLPFFRNLSAANGGPNSKGIALTSDISTVGQITLDSAGPVTQGAASLFAGNLLLAGPGAFTLTNPANDFGAVSLAGIGNSALTAQSLPITSFGGRVFDTASNALVTIGGDGNGTLAGNLTLTTTDGNVSSSVPIVNTSGHDITLGMHAAGSIRIGADVSSPTGAMNVDGDATSQVIVGGVANQTDNPRIAVTTNGGSVNFSAAGRDVFGSSESTGVTGPAVSIDAADIDTRGRAPNGALSGTDGAVALQGLTPATTSFSETGTGRPVAIEVNSATISTGSGAITLVGQSLDPVANPGNGVILRGTPANPTQLTTTTGPVRIHGTGSGFGAYGVALVDGSHITTFGGAIELLGAIAGTGTGAPSPTYGLLLLSGAINASAPGGAVSLAGSTTTADAGIAYGAVPLPANPEFAAGPLAVSTGAGGFVKINASNNGAATSLLGRSAPNSISPGGGSLYVFPGSVDPTTFAVTAQNSVPITLFGTSATPGLSIDSATYATFATSLHTLVLGSSTQTGKITVDGPCAGGANCASRPNAATSLTLENTGAGSQGIDLPSGIAMPANATLALDSAGTVTDPGGIQTGALLLAGGGDFALTDPNNDVTTLAIAGARDVNFANAHGFTIGPVSATAYDSSSGASAAIDGSQSTLSGKLVAVALTGGVTLGAAGAPTGVSAGGSIDLAMDNGVFTNAGGGRLNTNDVWRVWASTWQGENRNGIDPGNKWPNFYGCAFGGLCSWNGQSSMQTVSDSGNHFVYAQQPTLRVTLGSHKRPVGTGNGPLDPTVTGLQNGDQRGNVLAGTVSTPAGPDSPPGTYPLTGSFTSLVGYRVEVVPGTITVTPPDLASVQGAVFNRSGLQPLFTAQEESFVYESNLGGINVCVGTNEPILALQQSEGPAGQLASEWKRVRSRPNLNNCLVVNGQHGCGEF